MNPESTQKASEMECLLSNLSNEIDAYKRYSNELLTILNKIQQDDGPEAKEASILTDERVYGSGILDDINKSIGDLRGANQQTGYIMDKLRHII